MAASYCRTNCTDIPGFLDDGWDRFCDHVVIVNKGAYLSAAFHCNPKSEISYFEEKGVSNVCDGTVDCPDGIDEIACPGRFYCTVNTSERVEWISPRKVCDHVKDCSNGQDECGPCEVSNFLIKTTFLLILTALAGVAMVIINLIVGVKCFKSTPSISAGKVDRFLCLQVLVFDGMMGVYNCGIVVAALVLRSKGDYCPQDEDWRSSYYCQILGLTFSIASHGSLIAIASMSVVRCINCIRIQHQTKLSTIFTVSGVLIGINAI